MDKPTAAALLTCGQFVLPVGVAVSKENAYLERWRNDCLFTQSHADHVIGLKDERSYLMKAKLCVDTVLAKGRSCVFPWTGKNSFIDLVIFGHVCINERG